MERPKCTGDKVDHVTQDWCSDTSCPRHYPETICPICGGTMSIATPALKFLHEQVHSEPFMEPFGLNKLPFVLFERVARLMEDFSDKMKSQDD